MAELDDLTGIRRSSQELLEKMGVELSVRSKTELAGSAREQSVNAQTALAKGITAQRSGTVVEALNYYYSAASYDSGSLEVSSRLSSLQSSVKSGNFREDARNEIQQRNAWLALLKECEDFYKVDTRRYPVELIYDPAIYPVSEINFKTETQNFATRVELRPTRDAQNMLKVIQNLRSGLNALGQKKLKEWSFGHVFFYGLDWWPVTSAVAFQAGGAETEGAFYANYYASNKFHNTIAVKASLINENGKVLGTDVVFLGYEVEIPGVGYPMKMIFKGYSRPSSSRDSQSTKVWWHNNYAGDAAITGFRFPNVPVNDITDRVTIKIISIFTNNGENLNVYSMRADALTDGKTWKEIDSETAGKTGLIKISAGTVRNPNSFTGRQSSYARTITAETDIEEVK